MIEIHFHVLPGVDDGPQSMEESVQMCRMAAAEGSTDIVATPHQRHESWPNEDRRMLQERIDDLRAAVGPDPRLHLGAEIAIDSELLPEIAKLPSGELLPLAGSRSLLLEFHRQGFGPRPESLMHEVILSGFQPVLAHPELIPNLGEDMDLMERLVHMGVVMQVSAMSVTGENGKTAYRRTHELLDRGLVHLVASDAHGATRRPPRLRKAYEHLVKGYGDAAATRLTCENPRGILEGRPIVS